MVGRGSTFVPTNVGLFEEMGRRYGVSAEEAMGNVGSFQGASSMRLGMLAGTNRRDDSIMDAVNRLVTSAGVDAAALGGFAGAGRMFGGGMTLDSMDRTVGMLQESGLSSAGVNEALQKIAANTQQLAMRGVRVNQQDMVGMLQDIKINLADSRDPEIARRFTPALAQRAVEITSGFGQGPM